MKGIRKIRRNIQVLSWTLTALLPCAALAEHGLDLSIPKAAPPSALKIERKGAGDPYPEADALLRHNMARILDGDWQGLRAHDNSGAVYSGSYLHPDPRLQQMEDRLMAGLLKCQGMESQKFLPGVSLTDDLHDFVLSLSALQATLALRGQLFAPWGVRDWKALRLSTYLDADVSEGDGGLTYVQTRAQGFQRVVFFITTASPRQVHDAVVQLAALRGYEEVRFPKVPGVHVPPGLTVLKQPVTPHMFNNAALSVSTDEDRAEDRAEAATFKKLAAMKVDCLITDELGRSWLQTVNPVTGRRYELGDLRFGALVQGSAIPLGEKTEYFTNAHVADRLARERNMTPEQIVAERNALEERKLREAAKKAPHFRAHLEKSKELMLEAAAADKAYGETTPALRAEMRSALSRAGFSKQQSIDYVEQLLAGVGEAAQRAADYARTYVDYIARRLQSFWG
ncbi:MAG: hypothetical protein OWQ56_02185 [Acidithiobacillus caldus]|nr:hypothetical protein [Acidithiobacillus caldus]